MRCADSLVCPSQTHADEITQELHLPANRVRVIPNCLDLAAFMALDSHEKASCPIVLFSGRLEKRKGVDLLIQAARRVIDRLPDVHFLLAGAPHASLDLAPIKDEIKRDGIDKNILFLGHLPWDDLLGYYYQADVFVLPSFYETFGIVALEAMASGTPVVAWRAGALPEVITDGVDGLLVAPGDVEGLSCAMLNLLQNPAKATRMGKAAREAAKAFDLETILEENIQMYEESLDDVD
jgi:glycogen(starch) synthase